MYKISLIILITLSSCINNVNDLKNKPTKSVSEIVQQKQAQLLATAYHKIDTAKLKIQNGDLICRTGFDFISLSLQNFNVTDKSYSHSGIAFIEDGKIFIYHSIAGEDENPDEAFLREPFDSFVNPIKKKCFGVYRYKLTPTELHQFDSSFKELYKRHVKFDRNFNLADDERQYCSEAIYKCLKKSTSNRVLLPTTIRENFKTGYTKELNINTKRFEYIALDNLYLNQFCDSIYKANFNLSYPIN